MNYPKRGEMSADGRLYTHTDGRVYARLPCPFNVTPNCKTCRAPDGCRWLGQIEGAYVPSADELAACVMARAMIKECATTAPDKSCCDCNCLFDETCPARAYLASKGDEKAWEVAT